MSGGWGLGSDFLFQRKLSGIQKPKQKKDLEILCHCHFSCIGRLKDKPSAFASGISAMATRA